MGGAQKVLRARRALQVVCNPPLMHRLSRHIHRRKTPLGGRFTYDRRPLYAWRGLARRWLLWLGLLGLLSSLVYAGLDAAFSSLMAWLMA